MSFGGGSGGGGSIASSSDVALSAPANGQVLTYNTTLGKWQNAAAAGGSALTVQDEGSTLSAATTSVNFTGSGVTATNSGGAVTVTIPGGSGSNPGTVYFDSYFAGATDDNKIASMNSYMQGLAANTPRPTIVFDSRKYNFSTSIMLYSGLSLMGGKRVFSDEYGTGTILNWQGASGTSMFTFPGSQTGQGYPGDGSPRDVSMYYLEFTGGSTVNWMPKLALSGSDYSGQTLWMTTIHECGWVGFNTLMWGYGDGLVISGVTHIQSVANTAFYVGGSESSFFSGGMSYQDNSSTAWMTSGLPFFRCVGQKFWIGAIEMSARQNSYQISIETGAQNIFIADTLLDAPFGGSATYGSSIKISGGQNIVIQGCSIRGQMSNPSAATGGTAANGGIIHITGGSQIVVANNAFHLDNTNATADTPLVYVGASVGAGQVKIGLNAIYGYNGVVKVATAGQAVSIDPGITVTT